MRRGISSSYAVAALLGAVALIALLGYGLAQSGADATIESALSRGDRPRAPDFELPRLEDPGDSSLVDYRGQVVVLNFWASWCPPCRAESPLLQRWHERLRASRRATVLGVDALDVTSDARAFVRRYRLTYPMLKDRDGTVPARYGVVGYPETFVIDPRGRIVAARRGPVDDAFMRREVLPQLGTPRSDEGSARPSR